MLQAAAEVVGRATTLLTFNGESFDAPVMETRWALHRLPSPLEALRHVDLLHPARRLWRSDEGRLASLERAVLGLRRVDDVPGAEVPGRYVAFLRSGDPRLLAQIIEHNRLDLVSLGVLAGLTCQHVRDGATAGTDPEQALGLGRIYERVGWRDATITCYRRAARTDGTPATRAEALRRLALHHRRGQRHVEAADAWQRVAGTTGACSGAAAGGERCAGRVSRASGRQPQNRPAFRRAGTRDRVASPPTIGCGAPASASRAQDRRQTS